MTTKTTTKTTKTTTKTTSKQPNPNNNPNVQKTRLVIQTAVEYTRQCLAIVHRYIELSDIPNVVEAEQQLLRDAQFITRAHYEDITEERACSDLCGYPLCPNVLSQQSSIRFKPAQRYHIKANKVYDISRRRHFCSDVCFRCSEHLAGQISAEPMYMRSTLVTSTWTSITLLSKEEAKKKGGGLAGEEVKLQEADPLIKDFKKKEAEKEKEKEFDLESEKEKKPESSAIKPPKTTPEEVVLTNRAKLTALRAERRVETQLQSPYIKDEEFKELRSKFRQMAVKEKNISANGVAIGLLPKTEEEKEGEENDSDDKNSDDDI